MTTSINIHDITETTTKTVVLEEVQGITLVVTKYSFTNDEGNVVTVNVFSTEEQDQ